MYGKLALAVLGLCSVTIQGECALRCRYEQTADIEDHRSEDLVSEEFSQYIRLNDTHYRVCQCEAKPCLKKCCGKGEFMLNEGCREGEVFGTILPKADSPSFHLVYGNGCPKSRFTRFYPDDYTNVRYHLTANGTLSVYIDGNLREVEDFCLDGAVRRNSSWTSTGDVICIRKEFPPGFYEFPLGMSISVPFLLATLIVYSFRELRTLHSKNLNSHVGCLLSAYLTVILVETTKSSIPESVCIVLGFLRQFSFLSSFFWLNVMCFDLWWTLSAWSDFKAHTKEKEQKKYRIYSLCGWGCPAVIVLVTLIIEFAPTAENVVKPGIGLPNCFLRDGEPFYAYFYGPVIFIFWTDVTLFILSGVRFVTKSKKLRSAQEKEHFQGAKTRYFLVLKFFVMMSINWIIDPFSWIFGDSFWTWLFIHLSVAFQAICIFFIFVWKAEVKNLLISKFCLNSYSEMTTATVPDVETGNKTVREGASENTTV